MKPSDIRDHISQQCGFNSGVETPRTVDPNDAMRQAAAITFEQAKEYWRQRDAIVATINKAQQGAKPYALQVCNAGKMPDHLPQSFSEWLASNSDAIEMPLDRTEATAQWFDEQDEKPWEQDF